LILIVKPFILVCLFFTPPARKSIFPKEKTEKMKADKKCGKSGKPKGNGISPEGWICEERAKPLCRSLLVFQFALTAIN
jgi:hypothetical protein